MPQQTFFGPARRRNDTEQGYEDGGRRVGEKRGDTLPLVVIGGYLAVLGTTGGGRLDLLPLAAASLAALCVMAMLLFADIRRPANGPASLTLWTLAAIVLLPLMQLVPLPPALWRKLPGQVEREMVLDAARQGDAWQPLSLTPIDTAAAALGAICFVTLVIALIRVHSSTFRKLLWIQFSLIVVGIVIGVTQVISAGWPRLHDRADFGFLIGFFANKNHMGAALAASLMLAWRLLRPTDQMQGRGGRQRRSLLIFAGYWALVIAALVVTNSRAGLALGMGASAAIAWRMTTKVRPAPRILAVVALSAAAATVMLTPSSRVVSDRFNLVNQDLRWQYLKNSVPLIKTYWVQGSGIGSYSRLYAVHEPLDAVKPTFVNQAHNEYVQLVVEAGLPGIAAALLFFIALARGALALGKDRGQREALFIGLGIVLVFLLHSVVDYPLRRPAGFALFAVGCALLWRQGSLSPSAAERLDE